MKIILFGLVLVGVVAGQECVDIPPTITFPCDFQTLTGGCDPPYDALKDTEGRIVYCLVICDLCGIGDVNASQTAVSIDPPLIDPCYHFEGHGRSPFFWRLPDAIASNITEAIDSIRDFDLELDSDEPIVRAVNAVAQAVANAIASAMAEVSLRGATMDDNCHINIVNDSATVIALDTAEAYAVAIAHEGSDFTELEASTLITNTERSLIGSAFELAGTDRWNIDNVLQTTYAAAVAEAVINSTAQAFAKLMGTNAQAIALATTQAFNTSQLTCLSICNEEPPFAYRTCYDYVTSGECPSIAGSCECACDTCSPVSEASISTYINLISGSDIYQTINVFSEVFAAGFVGVNAIARALVQAVTQGHANATANTIAEAFDAVPYQISASALVDAIAIAINDGGQKVTKAVADGFVLAERDGWNAQALAQAILYAFTSPDTGTATTGAITQAISTVIADGGCDVLAETLYEAQAMAEEENNGPAFAAAIADSDSINSCLIGSTIAQTQAIAEGIKQGNTTAFTSTIASAAAEGKASTIADGIVIALSKGAPTSAVIQAVAAAVNIGNTGIIDAFAQGFIEAESSALSEVYAEGLGNGGSNAEAISTVISKSVAIGNCSAIASTLAEAENKANNRGKGTTFTGSLSESVAYCLQIRFPNAQAVSNAVVEGNINAIAKPAATLFAEGYAQDVVWGLALAYADDQDCTAIIKAASAAAAEAEAAAVGPAFSEAVAAADSVSSCLRQGLFKCRGAIKRSCCTSAFPLECNCSNPARCRNSMNMDFSIPLLGLYVYNEGVGSRICACDQMA